MEQTAIIDGKVVSYYLSQGESDSFFLFLHGRGRSKEDRTWYLEKLKEKKVWFLALDFPWFWKSQYPWAVRGIPEYSEFILHCLEKFEISVPISLVGHSFWGRVAFYLASQFPKKIKNLFLCAPWGVEKIMSPFRKKLYALGKKILSFSFLKPLKKFLLKKLGSADYLWNPWMREILVKVVNQDLRQYFPSISQEVFLFRWTDDDQILRWQIDEMKKGIKNLHYKEYPWGSHDIHFEEKEEILKELVA